VLYKSIVHFNQRGSLSESETWAECQHSMEVDATDSSKKRWEECVNAENAHF